MYRSFKVLVVLSLISSIRSVYSDWEQSNGPSGLRILSIANNAHLMAAGAKEGIFLSKDHGMSWSRLNNKVWWPAVNAIVFKGDTILAGTESGVFSSADQGISWSESVTGLTNRSVRCITVHQGILFAGTTATGVFKSTDNGLNWTTVNIGLTDLSIQCFTSSGKKLYAGTNAAGIFVTENNGESWTLIGSSVNGLFNTNIRSLAVLGNKIFAGTNGAGLFQSKDNGTNWSATPGPSVVDALLAVDNILYIGGTDELYASFDTLATIIENRRPVGNREVLSLTFAENHLYAGTSDGVFKFTSDLSGNTMCNRGLSYCQITKITSNGSTLFASTNDYKVFTSKDNGVSWTSASYGIRYSVSSIATTDKKVFAPTYMGIYSSKDNGVNWSTIDSGLGYNINSVSVAVSKNTVYLGTAYGGIFKLIDTDEVWTPLSQGQSQMYVKDLEASDDYLYATNSSGELFVINSHDNSWKKASSGLENREVLRLAATNKIALASTKDSCIFFSIDNGATWSSCTTGLWKKHYVSLGICNDYVFAATLDSCVYYSEISDIRWRKTDTQPNTYYSLSMTVSDGYLLAGSSLHGVWRKPLSDLSGTTGTYSRPKTAISADRLKISPNGTSSIAEITFSLSQSAHVTISMYSVSGEKITTVMSRHLKPGNHLTFWNTTHLKNGCYIVRADIDGEKYSSTMMVFR